MPFFRFACRTCKYSVNRLKGDLEKAKSHIETCPECGAEVSYSIGVGNAIGRETKDEYRNISNDLDHKEKIDERAKNHFQNHDLPRIIAKEGKQFAIRNGWLDEDGNPKK